MFVDVLDAGVEAVHLCVEVLEATVEARDVGKGVDGGEGGLADDLFEEGFFFFFEGYFESLCLILLVSGFEDEEKLGCVKDGHGWYVEEGAEFVAKG